MFIEFGKMNDRTSTQRFGVNSDASMRDQFPQLAALQVTFDDLESLSAQGFVSVERRGNCLIHKLRFRRFGRQVVRYLGGAEAAAQVRAELAILQRDRRLRQESRRLIREASKVLRASKQNLEPLLSERGFAFHGLSIRRTRRPPLTASLGSEAQTTEGFRDGIKSRSIELS